MLGREVSKNKAVHRARGGKGYLSRGNYRHQDEVPLAQRWRFRPIGYEGGPGKEKQMQTAADRFNELSDYYNTNTIWLDKPSRERMEVFLKTLRELFEDFSWVPESGTQRDPQEIALAGPNDKASRREIWNEAYKRC